MAIERERKFDIQTAGQWQRLSELNEIGIFSLTPAQRVVMTDSYLDSANEDIRAAGYVLRIRETGRLFVAGLKSVRVQTDVWHVREEYEQEVPNPTLDVEQWPDGPVTQILMDASANLSVRPTIRLGLVKHKRNLQFELATFGEWSLDEIRVEFPRRPGVLRELEIELKGEAQTDHLDQTLTVLEKEFGLTSLTQSKLDRARSVVDG